MSYEFDAVTTLAPVAGDEATLAGDFGTGWLVGKAVNGGVALAVAARALSLAAGPRYPDAIAVTGTYLNPSIAGPLTVRTDVLRRGGSLATGSALLLQPDADGTPVPRVLVQGSVGDLGALPPDDDGPTDPPTDLPAVDDCISSTENRPPSLHKSALLDRFDMRLDPATLGWALGEPSHRGMIQGWFRLRDGREPDTSMLLFAVDALPPVTADLGRLGWAPTLQLSVYARARPAPGWLQLRHETRHLSGGQFEEDARIWDSTGTLVAQARQLARVPR
ncbi:thioesterase family protein [Naumannella huperziae]